MSALSWVELCEQEFSRAVYYEKHLPKWRFFARWKAKQDMRVWYAAMRETMNR